MAAIPSLSRKHAARRSTTSNVIKVVLLTAVVAAACIFSATEQIGQFATSSGSEESLRRELAAGSEPSDLPWPGRALEQLHMKPQGTLIVVIVSCAYLDMLDNSLESMRNVGLTNVAIVPMDETARDVLRELVAIGVVLDVPPFARGVPADGAAKFGSKQFQALTASRPEILKAILESRLRSVQNDGDDHLTSTTSVPSLFYSDIDTFFQHDPIPFFRDTALEMDFTPEKGSKAAEYNKPVPPDGGALDPSVAPAFDAVAVLDSTKQQICSCFLFLRATSSTLRLLDAWSDDVASGRFENDQKALGETFARVRRGVVAAALRVYPRNNPHVPNGQTCDSMRDRSGVLIAHNNWLMGHEHKVLRFRDKWGMWRPSGRLERLDYRCGKRGVAVKA